MQRGSRPLADAGAGTRALRRPGSPSWRGVQTACQLCPAHGHRQPGQELPRLARPFLSCPPLLQPEPTAALLGGKGTGLPLEPAPHPRALRGFAPTRHRHAPRIPQLQGLLSRVQPESRGRGPGAPAPGAAAAPSHSSAQRRQHRFMVSRFWRPESGLRIPGPEIRALRGPRCPAASSGKPVLASPTSGGCQHIPGPSVFGTLTPSSHRPSSCVSPPPLPPCQFVTSFKPPPPSIIWANLLPGSFIWSCLQTLCHVRWGRGLQGLRHADLRVSGLWASLPVPKAPRVVAVPSRCHGSGGGEGCREPIARSLHLQPRCTLLLASGGPVRVDVTASPACQLAAHKPKLPCLSTPTPSFASSHWS